MTPRQREALDFITGYCREHGCSPSLDEVRAALGLKSKSSVARLIEGLEAGGHIVRNRYRARGIIPADMVLGSSTKRAADFIADILRSHDAGRITTRDAVAATIPPILPAPPSPSSKKRKRHDTRDRIKNRDGRCLVAGPHNDCCRPRDQSRRKTRNERSRRALNAVSSSNLGDLVGVRRVFALGQSLKGAGP